MTINDDIGREELQLMPALNKRERVEGDIYKAGGETATSLVLGPAAYCTLVNPENAKCLQESKKRKRLAEKQFKLLKNHFKNPSSEAELGFNTIDGIEAHKIESALTLGAYRITALHWCTMKVFMRQEGFIE